MDTQGWRFGDERTQSIKKYQRLEYRPEQPLSIQGVDEFVAFVNADIEWQIRLGADALLLPSLMPERGDDSAIRSLSRAVEVAMTNETVAARPLIGFLGVHSLDLTETPAQAKEPILQLLSAMYVQITPIDPINDSLSKLVQVAESLLSFEAAGLPVVAGHLGAVGGVLRSMGIAAADAGLGTGETFDAKRLLRSEKRGIEDPHAGGGMSTRRYLVQLLRSVSPKQWAVLMGLDSVRGFLDCRLPCCRFRTIADRTDFAREHSLRSRVSEAADLAAYSPTMRVSRQRDLLQAARTSLVMVNSALHSADRPQIPSEHVENHLGALDTLTSLRSSA